MNGLDILACTREQLFVAITQQGSQAASSPLPISPWLAMSLLQKAIRRDREDLVGIRARTSFQLLLLMNPTRPSDSRDGHQLRRERPPAVCPGEAVARSFQGHWLRRGDSLLRPHAHKSTSAARRSC